MKFKILPVLLALSGIVLAEDTVLEVIPLQNRPAEEIQPLLAPLLEENDRVIDNGSSLIVKTTPARLQSIQALIKKLDARLSNLVISVLQSSTKTAAELNAEAGIAISPSGIGMRGMVGDTRGLRDEQATQMIRTLEGQAAHIKTGQVRPVQDVTVYGSGYGYPSGSTTTQMVEASTGFAVTPRLAGQQVILDIEPWSDRFQHGGSIETQGASTSIRANLGEWVEIGGSDTGRSAQSHGFNSYNQSTREKTLRILIKVDRAD
ncbi:MAG: secretin N-terminal domain-containing protein [Methylomonas sp.]